MLRFLTLYTVQLVFFFQRSSGMFDVMFYNVALVRGRVETFVLLR
jgi:hypothetical protein